MPDHEKSKLGKIVKKGVSRLKKELEPKKLKKHAGTAAKGAVNSALGEYKRANRKKSPAKKIIRPGATGKLRLDHSVSGKFEIKGDKKKRKEKKKIKKWEKEKKAAASVGAQQAAFLALDKKYKKQNKK